MGWELAAPSGGRAAWSPQEAWSGAEGAAGGPVPASAFGGCCRAPGRGRAPTWVFVPVDPPSNLPCELGGHHLPRFQPPYPYDQEMRPEQLPSSCVCVAF